MPKPPLDPREGFLRNWYVNPFGLVYRGALTENEAGQVNIHRITYSLDGLMAFDASEGMYLYFILAEVIRH